MVLTSQQRFTAIICGPSERAGVPSLASYLQSQILLQAMGHTDQRSAEALASSFPAGGRPFEWLVV